MKKKKRERKKGLPANHVRDMVAARGQEGKKGKREEGKMRKGQ